MCFSLTTILAFHKKSEDISAVQSYISSFWVSLVAAAEQLQGDSASDNTAFAVAGINRKCSSIHAGAVQVDDPQLQIWKILVPCWFVNLEGSELSKLCRPQTYLLDEVLFSRLQEENI